MSANQCGFSIFHSLYTGAAGVLRIVYVHSLIRVSFSLKFLLIKYLVALEGEEIFHFRESIRLFIVMMQ